MSDRLFLAAAAVVLVGLAAGAIGRSHAHPVTGQTLRRPGGATAERVREAADLARNRMGMVAG
jgi:hypothetical protein